MTAFERRTEACQHRLRETNADGLVCFPGPNLYYLSGVEAEPSERHFLLVIPSEGDPVFLVPELAGAQVREATWVEAIETWRDEDDPTERLARVLEETAIPGDGRLLLDDRLWATFTLDVESVLPDAEFGLASEVLTDLRVRKDDREIEALREAAEVADEVALAVREMDGDLVGTTESELAREIDSRMRDRGGEPSFETIVASGANGAKPHHHHGDREIQPGDPVVLDFGCYLDAYPSDHTRTIVPAGDPLGGFEEAFEAVREAQRAGVAAVEPGVTAGEVDRAARAVIEDRGFGDAFVHRTGHGVGLEVHEEPYIVEGSDRELEPGMVFSVEPGVYLEGEFGVRIEDLVVVTEEGCERLNDTPRDWRP